MAFCGYSRDAAMYDVTPVENMFLLEFMPAAPEGFVRVYLYMRMCCAHPELGGELADVARSLHMEENTVLNAMQYWERQGLAEKLSDRPPSYALRPLRSDTQQRTLEDQDYYKYRQFNSSLQALFGTSELLEPKQYRMANEWLTMLGFSEDAALRLMEYELRQPGGRKPDAVFKRANKQAMEWDERGIHTLEEVEREIAGEQQVYETASSVLKRLSINHNKPTIPEQDCVRRWLNEWGLTREEILAACDATTKSREPSVAYLDAILKARVEGGSGEHFEAMKLVLSELGAANTIPTPTQTRTYASFLEAGFSPETVRLAAVQCAGKRKHSFEDLEWMLSAWDAAGVHSENEARRYIAEMKYNSAQMRSLLQAAGLSRRPNAEDIALYGKWKTSFSPEMLRYAAQQSNGTARPVKYMEKLLDSWSLAGITTPEAARAEHERHAQEYKTSQDASTSGGSLASQSGAYIEHDYNQTDFGNDFFYDLDNDDPAQPDSDVNGNQG